MVRGFYLQNSQGEDTSDGIRAYQYEKKMVWQPIFSEHAYTLRKTKPTIPLAAPWIYWHYYEEELLSNQPELRTDKARTLGYGGLARLLD